MEVVAPPCGGGPGSSWSDDDVDDLLAAVVVGGLSESVVFLSESVKSGSALAAREWNNSSSSPGVDWCCGGPVGSPKPSGSSYTVCSCSAALDKAVGGKREGTISSRGLIVPWGSSVLSGRYSPSPPLGPFPGMGGTSRGSPTAVGISGLKSLAPRLTSSGDVGGDAALRASSGVLYCHWPASFP